MQRYELTPTLPSLAGRVFYVYANSLAEALSKFEAKFNPRRVNHRIHYKVVEPPNFDVSSLVDNRVAPGS